MKLGVALENPGARRVLRTLLERQYGTAERSRAAYLRLTAERMPEFGPGHGMGEADAAWDALKAIEAAGFLRFDPQKPKVGVAAYEQAPMVRLVEEKATEACELLGLRFGKDAWTLEWESLCSSATWLSEPSRLLLAARPHRIGQRMPMEVLGGWKRLMDPTLAGQHIRSAASLAFWRLSKELDHRLELVNALRVGAGLEALRDTPILLMIRPHQPPSDGILFIENQSVFDDAVRGHIPAASPYALVYASGFKATASRVRHPNTASVYPADEQFSRWLFSDRNDVPTYFWGDLDYSGMAILKALRASFTNLQAWEPGYRPMLADLLSGGGHYPQEADKEDQRRPGAPGCSFAETELLPAIEAQGRFVDQEGFLSDVVRKPLP